MKLSIKGLSLSLGLFYGLSMLIFAWLTMYFNIEKEAMKVTIWFYPGYAPTYIGGIIGFGWGFISGLVSGFFIALFYNMFGCCCKKNNDQA